MHRADSHEYIYIYISLSIADSHVSLKMRPFSKDDADSSNRSPHARGSKEQVGLTPISQYLSRMEVQV